jgi:hypothetical protein
MQDIVIETYSMSSEDWLRTRAISWMISFLYFDKLVQIPIILIRELIGISYKQVFESFMNVHRDEFPILGEIRDFFLDEARLIQSGGVEYKYSEEWLGVYWPADEYVYIRLTSERKFASFYMEIDRLLLTLCNPAANETSVEAVQEAIMLNRALVSQPYFNSDIQLSSKYNIIDFWRGITEGQPVKLVKGNYSYKIKRTIHDYSDFQLWCKEVVWWGNKKGAYLYPLESNQALVTSYLVNQLAGHY